MMCFLTCVLVAITLPLAGVVGPSTVVGETVECIMAAAPSEVRSAFRKGVAKTTITAVDHCHGVFAVSEKLLSYHFDLPEYKRYLIIRCLLL